jgi:hypothetical protein
MKKVSLYVLRVNINIKNYFLSVSDVYLPEKLISRNFFFFIKNEISKSSRHVFTSKPKLLSFPDTNLLELTIYLNSTSNFTLHSCYQKLSGHVSTLNFNILGFPDTYLPEF